MPSLIVIVPYFGPMDWWGPAVLESMLRNAHVRFMLIGDRLPPGRANVRVHNWTFAEYRTHLSGRFDVDLSDWGARSACAGARCGRNPTNKASDTRPFLGALFEREVRAYDWWAWADFDVLFGHLVPPPAASDSVWTPVCPNPIGLATWGPFTGFPARGTLRTRLNRTIPGSRPYLASRAWRRVLRARRQMGFDELGFTGRKEEGLAAQFDVRACVRRAPWTLMEPRACRRRSWRPCAPHDAIDLLGTRDGLHLEGSKAWPRVEGATHALVSLQRFVIAATPPPTSDRGPII